MRIMKKSQLLLAFMGLFLSSLTQIASAANGRYALVIGNSDYVSVGNLGNPVRDARAVRKSFEKLGFTVIYGENLTRQQKHK